MSHKEIKFKVGRDAGSGKFIRVEEAKKRPNSTIIETIKRKPIKKK